MSKGIIISVIIGIVIVGSAAAILLVPSEPSAELNDEPETSTPEPMVPKGKAIHIELEDGLSMSSNP